MTEAANLARLSAAANKSREDADRAVDLGYNAMVIRDRIARVGDTHDLLAQELIALYRSGRLVLLPSVEDTSRAIHEYLSHRDIMQYLDNEEDCGGLATAIHNHLKGTGDAN